MGRKEKTPEKSQSLSWALRANQTRVCREGKRQRDRRTHLDKFTEVMVGTTIVKTSEELPLDQEWEARWRWWAFMVERKAEPGPREP